MRHIANELNRIANELDRTAAGPAKWYQLFKVGGKYWGEFKGPKGTHTAVSEYPQHLATMASLAEEAGYSELSPEDAEKYDIRTMMQFQIKDNGEDAVTLVKM